jgi:hypothetical protein
LQQTDLEHKTKPAEGLDELLQLTPSLLAFERLSRMSKRYKQFRLRNGVDDFITVDGLCLVDDGRTRHTTKTWGWELNIFTPLSAIDLVRLWINLCFVIVSGAPTVSNTNMRQA